MYSDVYGTGCTCTLLPSIPNRKKITKSSLPQHRQSPKPRLLAVPLQTPLTTPASLCPTSTDDDEQLTIPHEKNILEPLYPRSVFLPSLPSSSILSRHGECRRPLLAATILARPVSTFSLRVLTIFYLTLGLVGSNVVFAESVLSFFPVPCRRRSRWSRTLRKSTESDCACADVHYRPPALRTRTVAVFPSISPVLELIVWLIIVCTTFFETVTTKKSESGGNDRFAFGVSEMQGWRVGAYLISCAHIFPVTVFLTLISPFSFNLILPYGYPVGPSVAS